jgi:acyl carrier protein
VQNFVSEWTAFSKRAGRATAARGDEFTSLDAEDREALLDFAAERYCATSGLFGTREHCLEILERVAALDIDEIACLVDFGVDPDQALAHLDHLNDVRERASRAGQSRGEAYSLPALLRRHKVTHLQCTPSMARLMLADADTREALRGVRALMIGGEALPGEVAAELRELAAGPVLNMYGPTETTIWSATHRADESHGIVPIGRPIANTTLHVLDAARQPLPIGVAGELYIGGAGVARGYWNRPELTAERFVPDAFAGDGARLYRTGDRVRRRADGALEFLGRADFQVKIRGHRIELGEIESVLVRHPALRAVVVAARDDGRGEVKLVAYAVPMPGVSPPEEELARFAAERLPDFMVPDLFVRLEQFPLTPNGKIDRKALPEPHRVARSPEAGFVAPRTATEEKLSRIWSEVLGVQSVGVHDNFFELGGNSLSTIQISSRIREAFAVDLPLRAIFRTPSVAGIATAVEDAILTESDDPALRELLDEVEGMSEVDARALADRT